MCADACVKIVDKMLSLALCLLLHRGLLVLKTVSVIRLTKHLVGTRESERKNRSCWCRHCPGKAL